MPDNYAFINARLRAMHGALVTSKLEEALGAGSYGEFLRVLSETSLGADLGDATAQNAGLADLDRALSRNFYNTAQKVIGMADGEAGREIAALYSRYDLLNLKAVVRGKNAGRSSEDIETSLLPAGNIKPAALSALANANDLGALANVAGLAGTPIAGAFRGAVTQLAGDGNLLGFEVALDRAYYAEGLANAKSESLRAFLRREIDGANILTAMKLRAQGASVNLEDYFVSGGREVNRERFGAIAQGTGGLEGLSAFAALGEAKDLAQAESVVRGVILHDAKRSATADPLGVGVAIGFLKEKEQEVALTRLIARGKFYGVPSETLKREVAGGA